MVAIIIHQMRNQGRLPDVWRNAWAIHVFKKDGRSDPANYRPVSLTRIVCNSLNTFWRCSHIQGGHLDDKGILTPANHGFHQGHSCESQLSLPPTGCLNTGIPNTTLTLGYLTPVRHSTVYTMPHKRFLPSCGSTGSTVMYSAGLHHPLQVAATVLSVMDWSERVFPAYITSTAGRSLKTAAVPAACKWFAISLGPQNLSLTTP